MVEFFFVEIINNKDVNSNKEKVDNRKRHGYTIFICCK